MDSRATSAQGTICTPWVGSPLIADSRCSAAVRPTFSRHMSMLVSGGAQPTAIGVQLSKPISAMSPGMARPCCRSVSATPRAIWSLPQKMASTPGAERSRISAPSRPQRSLHSP